MANFYRHGAPRICQKGPIIHIMSTTCGPSCSNVSRVSAPTSLCQGRRARRNGRRLDRVRTSYPLTDSFGAGGHALRTALRKLAGHGSCFRAGNDAPLQVAVVPLVLEICGEDAGARLLARVEGETIDAAALARRQGSGDWLPLRLAGTPDAPRLQLIEVDLRLRTLLTRLGQSGVSLPAAALPQVRDQFPALAQLAPVRADEAVLGPPRLADAAPWLRLTLADPGQGEVALRVEIAVRPLANGAYFRPGEGEALVFSAATAAAEHARRDLNAERAAAEALRDALGLPAIAATLHGEAALEFIANAGERPGLRVVWERHSLRARRSRSYSAQVQVRSRVDWLEIGGKLTLEGEALELATALAALREGRRWVQLDKGGWVRLEGALAASLEAVAVRAEARGGALQLPTLAANLLDGAIDHGASVEGDPGWRLQRERLLQARALPGTPPPELRAELRDYQRAGIAWLLRMAHWAPGAVLADDMGLGKTLQALALLLARRTQGPALVVAPTSLGFGWQREAERFAPALRVHAYRGAERAALLPGLAADDVLVTSYDLLYRDIDALSGVAFGTVVFDEAQAMKNPHSRRARAATRLQAGFRLALSGTPVENRAADLWSVLRATVPGLLPGWESFRRDYALPIERSAEGPARQALAGLVGPFVLRRRKSDVLQELPDRLEVRNDVVLSHGERVLYDAVRAEAAQTVQHGTPEQRRFAVLAALTRLRQAACHPKLVDPGSALPSAKHLRLRELVAELREEGQQALVFSQFVRQLELAHEVLATDGARLLQLDGSTPVAKRGAIVDAFQRGEADVLLLSLKAGGTGLNLTAATTVILLDPWWNPAVEAQAGDRAHRIGQKQQVTVVRLVALGTVEDAILALQADKRELTEALLAGADGGAKLDTEALLALLSADSPDAALALVAAAEAAGGVDDEDDGDGDAADADVPDVANVAVAVDEDVGVIEGAGGEAVVHAVESTAQVTPSAPALDNRTQSGWLLAALDAALDAALADGRMRNAGSANTVRRVARRMLAFAEAEGLPCQRGREIEAMGDAYVEAVQRRRVEAPGSDLMFARNATMWLRSVL